MKVRGEAAEEHFHDRSQIHRPPYARRCHDVVVDMRAIRKHQTISRFENQPKISVEKPIEACADLNRGNHPVPLRRGHVGALDAEPEPRQDTYNVDGVSQPRAKGSFVTRCIPRVASHAKGIVGVPVDTERVVQSVRTAYGDKPAVTRLARWHTRARTNRAAKGRAAMDLACAGDTNGRAKNDGKRKERTNRCRLHEVACSHGSGRGCKTAELHTRLTWRNPSVESRGSSEV
jgi:hypothetical protein